ncbi:MAG: amidase domain-containing protein, partial [Acetobacteraceae bacterium]|nr:amidase domain-containing protein [Acetobacteraceae bacterium]
ELYNYEMGRLQYSLLGWELSNTRLQRFTYRPDYEALKITGNRAVARVRPWTDLVCADDPTRTEEQGGELHVISLVKVHGAWKLADDRYQDEMARAYPRGTDFARLQAALPGRVAELQAAQAEFRERMRADPRLAVRLSGPGAGDGPGVTGYRSYDRSRCASYATTYTNNNGDCSTTNYNTLFKEYASGGRCVDCQNFVSQCVWYGFGGTNTSTAIQGHWLPMLYGYGADTDWWADLYSTGTNWHWTSVPDFEGMATANYFSNLTGVHGYRTTDVNYTWAGDIVSMKAYSHVFMVNAINDYDGDGLTDYNEIYVCAHTNNRKNARLSNLVPSSSDVYYLWIMTYKDP